MIDILFILKKNETYGFKTTTKRSSGLWNSTRFIVEALNSHCGLRAEIIEVIDNNCIDRHVKRLKPRLVVIEALWVVPEKFEVLSRLHPNIKWFVHMHSGMAFLAQEGIAMEWLREYPKHGVGVIANSLATFEAFGELMPACHLRHLPNVYLAHHMVEPKKYSAGHNLHVGCFGAIRPLKNQLVQAIAAIRFADRHKKKLHFHINGTRQEVGGQPVLKNIRALFAGQHDAVLHEHPWYEPDDFHRVLRDNLDISLQLSLSETFNVVSADAVTCGVPIVVSDEIPWVDHDCIADTESLDSINHAMKKALTHPRLTKSNQNLLLKSSKVAQRSWIEFVVKE